MTKVSLKASGRKSLGLLVGIGFGLLLSLMTTLGFMASMHKPGSQDERSAAETKFQEDSPYAMILGYPPTHHKCEVVDQWLAHKAKQQLGKRNLLLIENHASISSALAQLEDESFELIPLSDGSSWGTNSDEIKTLLHEVNGLDFTEKSDCEAVLEKIMSELQTNASYVAFPAEARVEESLEQGPLDTPDDSDPEHRADDTFVVGTRLSEAEEQEQEMLDSMSFPGVPDTEQARRKAWLKIPRVARAAIRRLHVALGHQPKAVMLQILKGRKSAAELIEGCKAFKCPDCSEIENSSKVAKTKAPSMYSFNHEVVCDVWFIHDMDRTPFGILSFTCNGTAFQVSVIVMEGTGVPNSGKCFEKFESRWASWAGFPHIFTTDRGLHNRGKFAKGLKYNGVYLRQAALEAPEHIGRAERQQGILKAVLKKIIKAFFIRGKAQMKQALVVSQEVKNDTMKRGGFKASQ